MNKPSNERALSLKRLFLTMLKINFITFGGGYTIVPVIREAFVQKLRLFTEEEMLEIISLSESMPGAMATSCSYLVGLRVRGKLGGLVALTGSVLPPFLVISIVYYFYTFVSENVYIRAALRGMSGVVVAMLIVSTFGLFRSAIKKHPLFALMIMIPAAVLSYLNVVSTAALISGMAIIGLLAYFFIFPAEPQTSAETHVREERERT